MKKLLSLLICALLTLAAFANTSKVYVNALQNEANADGVIAGRLYKKGILGLTRAKTISVASGKTIKPGSAEVAEYGYDYIMDVILTNATIEEAGTLNNLAGAARDLFGKSSANQSVDWAGTLVTDIIIYDAAGGTPLFKKTLKPTANNKDKGMALFNATNNFDVDMTDMIDDVFRVTGEVTEATQVDKKNIVKKVRVGVGATDGARKNQAYQLYKVTGDNKELIGAAKCEYVLGDNEAILTINGAKGADKAISELIQNNDGSYKIMATSCSRTGFTHEVFQGLDKMFTADGRAAYMDPFGRESKVKVGVMGLAINDPHFANQQKEFTQRVVNGLSDVSTVTLNTAKMYPSAADARDAGLDGLVDVTIDKVITGTEQDREGKTIYKSEIFYTIAGLDVANNRWIEMKSYHTHGSSTENPTKANADALGLMDDFVKKFGEDVFPVAASIINSEEVDPKKGSVKKVSINAGTDMGLKKGMRFDIYEQRADGDADTRFLLAEGTVEKDRLSPTEAIVKVNGKDDGEKKLYDLLQNADENTKIVLISKAHYNALDKGLNFFNKGK